MQVQIHNLGLAVGSAEHSAKWIFGIMHEGTERPSPRAPWIRTHKALARAIREGALPTTMAPFFLPLVSERGLFREVPEAVLTEFLSLEERPSAESIVEFIRRFGVFHFDDLEADNRLRSEKMPRKVRVLWQSATERGKIPFAFSIADFRKELVKVRALWQIAAAVRERDAKTAASSFALFDAAEIGLIEGAAQHAGHYKAPLYDAERLVTAAIAVGLQTVRFAPVDFQGTIVPGLVTGCVRDAVYLLLMKEVGEGHTLRRCRFSKCKRTPLFIPDRADQFYCSRPCQNLANRYRQLGNSMDIQETK